jgi:hypothetical protein
MPVLASVALAALLANPAADVFYEALHGQPRPVPGHELLSAPGLHVGRAVRTRGRLARRGDDGPFELAFAEGRAVLRLEPAAETRVRAHAASWVGREVDVHGLVYRDASAPTATSLVLRAWQVAPVEPVATAARPDAAGDVLALEDLVYGAGRYDGRVVRVTGASRGFNLHRDLPESSRRSPRDWVLKEGHFAVWVSGHMPDAEASVEVVGVPTTSRGVVRIAAQEVAPVATPIPDPVAASGVVAPAPRLSFAYPVEAETLRADGRMILQFSRPMDEGRFGSGVRVRFERQGAVLATPALALDYESRHRALVITPQPPPPPGSDVVVELLDVVVDVSGRGLVRRDGNPPVDGVVERVRFRAGS